MPANYHGKSADETRVGVAEDVGEGKQKRILALECPQRKHDAASRYDDGDAASKMPRVRNCALHFNAINGPGVCKRVVVRSRERELADAGNAKTQTKMSDCWVGVCGWDVNYKTNLMVECKMAGGGVKG
jgi:hypothetical protein